jgi:tetratricopeptide (TPR) repeat protein
MSTMHASPRRSLRDLGARLLGLPVRELRAAEQALAAGRLDAAQSHAGDALARAPDWAESYHVLARIAAERGEHDRVEHFEREALARDPAHTEAESALRKLQEWRRKPLMDAWAHYHALRWLEAAEGFFAAVRECGVRVPEACRAEALAGLGWSRLELALPAAAADAFWEALAAAPRDVSARRGLAIAWYQLGSFERARALLDALLGERPDLGSAWAFQGWCEYALGRWQEADASFARAQAADPTLADARWGRGWSRFRLAEHEDALREMRAAVELGALHPSAGDMLDLAVWNEHYATLLEPLATALVRAEASSVVEMAAARATHLGRTAAAHRLQSAARSASADPTLDALAALIERRTDALERAGASGRNEQESLQLAWLRARNLELQGNFTRAREIVRGLAPRHAARREWRELAERLAVEVG